MGETLAHSQLRRLAVATLLRWGCQAAATEVLCPISRYRVDAAGYLDAEPVSATHDHTEHLRARREAANSPPALFDAPPPTPQPLDRQPRPRCEPRTVIIECKQSRADFLRDRTDLEEALRRRERLHQRLARLIPRLLDAEPHLRASHAMLFDDTGTLDLTASTNPTYLRIAKELDRADESLHGNTKFHRLAQYRLADRLYLLTPPGIVKRSEVPPGWGLIECPRAFARFRRSTTLDLAQQPPTISVEAPRHTSPPHRRARLLRNIAVALTRHNLNEPP